jgi:glutathione synthase
MKPFIAFQIDPFETLNPKTDTSLMIAHEGMRRGYKIFGYGPSALSVHNANVYAYGYFFNVTSDGHITHTSSLERIALECAAAVFIRQNPPYDMGYLTPLSHLAHLPKTTKVLNNPNTLRLYGEKCIPLLFPDFIPDTCISTLFSNIMHFVQHHKRSVIKPLYGYGGCDVFVVSEQDLNTKALITHMIEHNPWGLIVQEYIEAISDGDRRLIFINGLLKSTYKRIPDTFDFRSNTAVGGSIAPYTCTDEDDALANVLTPFLKQHDIALAGVDIIGPYLIEVNITSPTGFRAAEHLYQKNLATVLWDECIG